MIKENLARLEKALANYVGPIAGLIVERARGRASTFEVLYQRGAWEIDNDTDRSAFLREMAQVPVGNGTEMPPPDPASPQTEILTVPQVEAAEKDFQGYAFDPDFIAKIEAELTPKLGKSAVQMVREAARRAHNEGQFYLALARLMPDKKLRDRILSRAIKVRAGGGKI